jgi:hypothetical protein
LATTLNATAPNRTGSRAEGRKAATFSRAADDDRVKPVA